MNNGNKRIGKQSDMRVKTRKKCKTEFSQNPNQNQNQNQSPDKSPNSSSRHSGRGLFFILLGTILIGTALYHILAPHFDRMESEQKYQKLAEDYVTVTEDAAKDDEKQKKKDWWSKDVKVEFDALKKENPDIIGWIRFDHTDQTGINYPIAYSGDNEKYLRTDIHGNEHIAGSIFLEGLNQPDFSDLYNIIYGHSMKNGTMFGSLKKYREDGFWKENQYFTVYTETTAYRYQIFAYETAANGSSVYQIGYQPGEEYQAFIDEMVENSDFDTGIHPEASDRILTLSTCTANEETKRFAIHAVCIDSQTTEEDKL